MATKAPKKTAGKTAAPKSAAAGKFQLCAQLFTLRDHCQTVKDFSATLKKLARIGYRLGQLSGPAGNLPAADIARCAKDAGVAIVGSHIGYNEWTTKYDEKLALLKTLGCRYTAIPSLGPEMRDSLAAWKKTAKLFNKLGEKLAKDGIVLQYHNHHFEFVKFAGRTGLEILYAESDPKFLQAEIDTCWVARGGGEPTRWILDMKGRMDQVHLKDSVIIAENKPNGWPECKSVFAEIGEGNLNWNDIIPACKKAGVKTYIIEQDGDWRGGNPFKSLEISYKFLSSKFGLK